MLAAVEPRDYLTCDVHDSKTPRSEKLLGSTRCRRTGPAAAKGVGSGCAVISRAGADEEGIRIAAADANVDLRWSAGGDD